MAKVLGPLHSSEARGRMGGLIFNTWRGIMYVKSKVAPAQPRSELQLLIRSQATYLVRYWATLTQQNRDTWNAYAVSHQDTDWTGQPKRITGLNWFLRCNMALLAMGGSVLETAPVTAAPDPPTSFETTWSTPSVDISWDPTAGTDLSMDLWIAGPGSGGSILPIEKARRLIVTPGETEPYELAGLQVGFYRIWGRVLSEISGLASAFVSDEVEVTAE